MGYPGDVWPLNVSKLVKKSSEMLIEKVQQIYTKSLFVTDMNHLGIYHSLQIDQSRNTTLY